MIGNLKCHTNLYTLLDASLDVLVDILKQMFVKQHYK